MKTETMELPNFRSDRQIFKSQIAEMFKELRKKKVIARMNFWCCQSCGCANVDRMFDEKPEMWGYVFYHQQDEQGIGESKPSVHVAYGLTAELSKDASDDERKEMDRKERELNRLMLITAQKCGLLVDWNGDTGRRMELVYRGGENEQN